MVLRFAIFLISAFALCISNGEGKIIECENDDVCESISPDPDDKAIHTSCEDSEHGNDKSFKVCRTKYVWDVDPVNGASGEMARNPNPTECKPTNRKVAVKACADYLKTYSPLNGAVNEVPFTQCYTEAKPYRCNYKGDQVIFCSIQATRCTNPCKGSDSYNKP